MTDTTPVEVPTLDVHPGGALEGRTLQMRRPSARFLIRHRRGDLDQEDWWEEVLGAIEDHDLGRDPDTLPAVMVDAIGMAWVEAMKDAAVPPAPAAS